MGSNDTIRFAVDDRSQLAAAISFVRAGLGGGKSLAEQIFRFDTGDGRVTVTASDGDLVASAAFQAEVNEPGSFAVVGKKVAELLTRAKDADHFAIAIDVENVGFLLRRSPSNQYTEVNFERLDHDLLEFAVQAAEKSQSLVGTQEQQIPRGILLEALGIAQSSTVKASGDLRCDHVELRRGHLLASDGRRISRVQTGAFHTSARLKVPVQVLGRIVQALKSLPKDRTISAHEGDIHYFLLTENRVLAVRKADADFPMAEPMFERGREGPDSVNPFGVDRILLQQTLAEVGLGLPQGKTEVELKVHGPELTVLTENSVGRKSKRTVSLVSGGIPGGHVSFPVSIDHLTATLSSMRAKEILLYHLPKTGALLLADTTEERVFDAVLPFRRAQAATSEEVPDLPGTGKPAEASRSDHATLDDGSDIVL